MPYMWRRLAAESPGSSPAIRLEVWPYRSLPLSGFAGFIGVTFALFTVPLMPLLGRAAFWEVLPFPLVALALLWMLLRRSYRLRLREELTVTDQSARLVRIETDGTRKEWQANPYWVRVALRPKGGPVENYLTLEGGPRSVELGAFLSPPERAALRDELVDALHGHPPGAGRS